MPRIKRPLPRSADLAFIRKTINTVNEIRSLRRFSDKHVEELRLDIAKRIANALWNRYKVYHRKVEDPPTFLDWLMGRTFLHETYLHHQKPTRLYWVYRVIVTTKDPELSLFGENVNHYGRWYLEMLEAFINERQPDADFSVKLYEVRAMSEELSEPVPTIFFERVQKL